MVGFYPDGRGFVNTHPNLSRVLENDADEPVAPPSNQEMLIDDGVVDEAKPVDGNDILRFDLIPDCRRELGAGIIIG